MAKYLIHADDFGRSNKISEKIFKYILKKKINSVSVMIGFVNKKVHKKLYRTNIPTRLHLNLTDNKNYDFNKNEIDTSFIKLLFLSKKNKKYVINEIKNQIYEYKKIYKLNKIKIDGHEHIHFIPWIYKYLIKFEKNMISEIRWPVEKINVPSFKYIFSLKIIKNFLSLLLVYLFSFYNKKKYKYLFFGLIYSGNYNKEILKFQKKQFHNLKKEILIHIGIPSKKEKNLFSKKYYKYFTSKNRYIEEKMLK